MMDLSSVKRRVKQYNRIQENTHNYREAWKKGLKDMIIANLESIQKETGLEAKIDLKDELKGLEAIAFSLGQVDSGIFEEVGSTQRHFVKSNGMLIYQQLFNGKIMISILYPFIEGLAKPKPPKSVEILRPEELKPAFIIRHVEEFLKEMISWEDYDDDAPHQTIGFQMGMPKSEIIASAEKKS